MHKILFSLLLISVSAQAVDSHFYGNRLIVKFKATEHSGKAQVMNAGKMQSLSDDTQVKLNYHRSTGGGARVLKVDPLSTPAEMDAVIAKLRARDDVEYAEIDYKRYPLAFPMDAPNDPFFASGEQWYLQDNSAANNRGAVNAEAVWKMGITGAGVTIAVIDTGFTPHPDLGSNIIKGYDFIGLDNDGSANTDSDSEPGRDNNADDPGDAVTDTEKATINTFKNDSSCKASTKIGPIHQSSWHGTVVSGILGALTDNAKGIAGLVPDAKILLSRALGKCGGYNSDLMDAARWSAGLSVPGVPANSNPSRIVNLSLGGSGSCTGIEQNAITAITNAGGMVVVAAGNEGGEARKSSPGNCNNVINVAASTRLGGEADYTNFGPEVTISAPGGSNVKSSDARIKAPIITTTQNPASGIGPITNTDDSVYAGVKGTSFSAPVVSGVIAMMLQAKPDLTTAQILSLLTANATPFPTGTVLNNTTNTGDSNRDCTTTNCGAGIVNAKKTIDAIQTGNIPSSPVANTSSSGGGATSAGTLLLALFGLMYQRITSRKRLDLSQLSVSLVGI